MNNAIKIPYQNLSKKNWLNLLLAAVATAFLLQVIVDSMYHSTCRNMGVDYCVFWSAGRIANTQGYPAIYELDILLHLQQTIYPAGQNVSLPLPFIYLPVFVLPFQLLALLPTGVSYWVWTLLNLAGFILYMRFFARKMTGKIISHQLMVMLLLSIPVFLNLYLGQSNILLLICAGEFLRAMLEDRPLVAGMWLGGLLLKPQTLMVILPLFLLRKQFKPLVGFSITLMLSLGLSLAMLGGPGVQKMWTVLAGSAQGMNLSDPEIMMNWRMLGLYFSRYISPWLGVAVIVTGCLGTAAATVFLGWKLDSRKPIQYSAAMVGILAATCAIAWHSHFSMACILIPPMALLLLQERLPTKLFHLWFFLPIGLTFLADIPAVLMQVGKLPPSTLIWLNLQNGLKGLGLNLMLLVWAISYLRRQNNELQFDFYVESQQ